MSVWNAGLRVAFGSLVYILILVLAAQIPSAAGMMLTFPALNGLGLLFTEQSDIPGTARSMLWMPVVNGALCASFIFLYLSTASADSQIWLAWLIFAAIAVSWYLMAKRKRVNDGIPTEWWVSYAIVTTILGATFLSVTFLALGGPTASARHVIDRDFLLGAWQTILANWYKVALFAIAFFVFLAGMEYWKLSPGRRGILAGLPLVPFAGLVSLPGFGGNLSESIAALQAMAVSVWLGPAVAIWFIIFISAFLTNRKRLQSKGGDFVVRFVAVLSGWIGCAVVISMIAKRLTSFS